MKHFTLGLLGAAALATTILLVRQQRDATRDAVPTSLENRQATEISLERMRELGL